MSMTDQHTPTISQWVRDHEHGLQVVGGDEKDPYLADHNVVAVTTSTEQARSIVSAWELTDQVDGDIGLVVLGDRSAVEGRELRHQGDPEGVTGDAARKAAVGGVPAAVIGAVVFGLVGLLLGSPGVAAGAAVGGAFFIGISVAVWAYVIATRDDSAYLETFVDPRLDAVTVVSAHGSDPAIVGAAQQAIPDGEGELWLFAVDRNGEALALD